jgi:DNA-binding MarR family transcriptional regulator
LRAEGLDRGGFDVLATLRRSGPPFRLTPTRLYTELVLTSGAITHRVDALARAGLVERISGSRDRRSTLVGLTDQGRVVADRAMAANLACEAAMAGLLADADREALAALLKKLLDGLETEEAEVQ